MQARRNLFYFFLSLFVVAGIIVACGKKKSNTEDNKSGGGETTQGVALSGQLAISSSLAGSNLEAAARGVILFKLSQDGTVVSMDEIAVNDRGEFNTTLAKGAEQADQLEACLATSPIDRACVKTVFPDRASEIDGVPEEELKSGLRQQISSIRTQGGFRYVLVSYLKSGVAKDEASSMQFIGMPTTGADDLRMIPVQAAKGSINLGEITGSGDEATAKTKANDSFDLTESALKDMANASQVLKIVKNSWINRAAKPARITPWFGYTSSDFEGARNQFSVPSALSYMGGGYYIKILDAGVTMNDICPESGNTAAKTIYWNPPSALTLSDNTVVTSMSSALTSGDYTRASQYGELSCGHSSLYTRAASYSAKEFMLQIGKNFKGDAPAGYWELKVDSDVKGFWDLSAAKPYDTNPTQPNIFVPAFKVTVTDGKATQIEAKFYNYDKAAGQYREITDVSGLTSMVHSLRFDVSYSQATGKGDSTMEGEFNSSGIVVAPIAEADQANYHCNGQDVAGCISRIGMSYYIGPVSYRMELRADGWN